MANHPLKITVFKVLRQFLSHYDVLLREAFEPCGEVLPCSCDSVRCFQVWQPTHAHRATSAADQQAG